MKNNEKKIIKIKRDFKYVVGPFVVLIGIFFVVIFLSIYSLLIGQIDSINSQGIYLWILVCILIVLILIEGLKIHTSNFITPEFIMHKGFMFTKKYYWENLTNILILDNSSVYYQKFVLVFGKKKLIFLTAEIKNKNDVLCEIIENTYDRVSFSFKVLKHFCMYIKPKKGTKSEKAYIQFHKVQNSLKTMPIMKMEEINQLLLSYKNEKIKPALDFEIKDYMKNKKL